MTSSPDMEPVTEAATLTAFRSALAEWLASNLTPEVHEAGRSHDEDEEQFAVLRMWNARLADAGWAAPSWPALYGGRDADIDQQLVYLEEMSRVAAPGPVNTIGVSNIAPAIMAIGTRQQKERFLRPMLRGDEIWSQGMSEPDAGSDLASLRTSAHLEGEVFVVNGQKTWNSLGRFADWCQLYVRTDPAARKHRGISCLLVDMTTPGITVRPLRTMTGDSLFSELFFDNVIIPRSALLGELNSGWQVAMTTLSHERAGVARLHLGLGRQFDELLEAARQRGAVTDRGHRDRLAALYTSIACMRYSTSWELAKVRGGGQPSATMGSLAKLSWARATQELAELAMSILGVEALMGSWAKNLALSPASSIAGGTGDINRNIVAEHGLGLPR
jgi:alkylation response protein AidB-like acyl-CoA dehydrogenase